MDEKERKERPRPPENPTQLRSDSYRSVTAMLGRLGLIFLVSFLILYVLMWFVLPATTPISGVFLALLIAGFVAVLGAWFFAEA